MQSKHLPNRLPNTKRFAPGFYAVCGVAIILVAHSGLAQGPQAAPDARKTLAAAQESAKRVPSMFLSEQQKFETVDAFVSIVSLPSPSGSEAAVRDELRQRLGYMGAEEIKCSHTSNDGDSFLNLVMEFGATTDFKDKPAVILNAHIDTIAIGHCTPELMDFDLKTREFFHRKNGSFGADDKAGVTVILGALKAAKSKYWDAGVGHRKVIAIFTAQEETGAKGATHLASQHPQIFENVEITISSDGNLDYDAPSFYPKSSFVVVANEKKRQDLPYAKIIECVREVCGSKGTSFSMTTAGLGMGDFAFFPPHAHSEYLHIRSPYLGDHSKERVKLDDLFNHIDLFTYILLRLDRTPIGLSQSEKR
jgi:putative aminopeptidase FrvX